MSGYIEKSDSMRKFAATALLAAIIFLMTFTPFGFINLVFINATTIHVPVIIGSILLGPRAGACLGFMFGLASLIRATVSPNILSFAFSPFIPVPGIGHGSLWALAICFIPRILVGVAPWYADRALRIFGSWLKPRVVPLFIAGVIGSATNTLLVTHMMFFLFKDAFAQAREIPAETVYKAVLAIITAHGIPEAIVAGVMTAAICKAMEAYRGRGAR